MINKVFNTEDVKYSLKEIHPFKMEFISIPPKMFGKVCRLWNYLCQKASNDIIVLFSDDLAVYFLTRDENQL